MIWERNDAHIHLHGQSSARMGAAFTRHESLVERDTTARRQAVT